MLCHVCSNTYRFAVTLLSIYPAEVFYTVTDVRKHRFMRFEENNLV
jgi:hypothetical protein